AARARQRRGRLGHWHEREAALRQRELGVAFGQPGVHEPEKALLHPEDLPGPRHLGPPHRGDVGLDLGSVHGRVQDVTALSAGQRADQDLGALADVARHGGRALARLVVRVRVHGHQPELVNVTWLTQEAYDRLKAELDHLSGPGRIDIAKKIEAAREEGDLRENGGYHAAKDEQGQIEARIVVLQHILENARVGGPPRTDGVV